MKLIRNRNGFTLVELIVIFAVAAIVLTPISMIMTSALRNEARIQKTIDADQSTQQSFIVLNELIRKVGFDGISIEPNYHGYTDVLHVRDKVFLLKGNNYVYQTYNIGSEQSGSELVLNKYVLSVTNNLEDTEHYLEIVFEIDSDSDGSVDNTFTYKYSKRE
ncbi:MAG: type II secretion system protein [Clostridiales bacterium]|nr:type II secretion system protein [Clostridiales bacterium]